MGTTKDFIDQHQVIATIYECPIVGDIVEFEVVESRIKALENPHPHLTMLIQACYKYKLCRDELFAFFKEKHGTLRQTDGSQQRIEWAVFFTGIQKLDLFRFNSLVKEKKAVRNARRGKPTSFDGSTYVVES